MDINSEIEKELSDIWASQSFNLPQLDEDCAPNKVCKNMKDVTLDGFATEGGDIRAAWKETLKREGKITEGSNSIGDLINKSSGNGSH